MKTPQTKMIGVPNKKIRSTNNNNKKDTLFGEETKRILYFYKSIRDKF